MRSLNIKPAHALRSAELATRVRDAIWNLERADEGGDALSLADALDGLVSDSTDSAALRHWRLVSGLLRALAVDLAVRAAARAANADVGRDRERLRVLLQNVDEIVREIDEEKLRAELQATYNASAPQVSKKPLLQLIARLPLPNLYLAEEKDRWPRPPRNTEPQAPPLSIPVIRLAAFLDEKPITVPQQLRSHTLHTLRFQAKGVNWPEPAERLRVELLCTCPPSLFHVSVFETKDHTGHPEFESTLTGSIQFNASQSADAADLAVVVRAAFILTEGSVHQAPVVGHNQFRFRVSPAPTAVPTPTAPAASSTGLRPCQFGALHTALLAAFTRESLQRMLRIKLDIRLDHIAGTGTLTDVVSAVIDWAEREGRVEQLVHEASGFVPNEQLQGFAKEFEESKRCN